MAIVAKDGSGDYSSIQAAVDAIPDGYAGWTNIEIRNGVYKEKLHILKPRVRLIGENAGKTIIFFDDFARKTFPDGEMYNTFHSYSVLIGGDDFQAVNITFANTAGSGDLVGQAIAVYVDGDRSVFRGCRFTGCQDTLFTAPLPPAPVERGTFGGPRDTFPRRNVRQYYEDCFIAGDVDFIFGSATAAFNRCEIFSSKRLIPEGQQEGADIIHGYVTAASTAEETEYGYIFENCRLTGDAPEHSVYLGRPWRGYAKTVFLNCWMGGHIRPEGWHHWTPEREKTVLYAEYGSTGPGAAPAQRVSWAHTWTDAEAEKHSIKRAMAGNDGWNPVQEEKGAEQPVTIFLAGDSTVADYPADRLPMLGWGAKLPQFLDGTVQVKNAATNGRSSKSFIDEGRLAAILSSIREGDVLIIQFGHNDSKEDEERRTEPWTTYQEYLMQYIEGARTHGAFPILVSSVCRRRFDDSGRLVDTHGEFPQSMASLANREGVPYVNLCAKSGVLLRQLGPDASESLFTWLTPGQHPNYPEGSQDNTHLNEHGAETVARLVAEELAVLESPLRAHIVFNTPVEAAAE